MDKLPSGFQADLGRLTDLLIGESVYQSNTVWIRELIQNARDACSRRQEKRRPESREPEIIISIDGNNRFIDIIDFGDGMTKSDLGNSFSVLGRTLNDEFHQAPDKKQHLDYPVTGKFGIGFISTFMLAQKIVLSTKSNEEPPYHFTMISAKDPFEYSSGSQCDRLDNNAGTTVRVYLRPEHVQGPAKLDLDKLVCHYCRHVPGLSIYKDKQLLPVDSDWNITPDTEVVVRERTHHYEIRLSWASSNTDTIKLSNGGFFVTDLGVNALGDFPRGLVTGEINVAPDFVDLNIARDNVVNNEKLRKLQQVIGNAISRLARETLKELSNVREGAHAKERTRLLAKTFRRACTIIDSKRVEGSLGDIALDPSFDFILAYRVAIVAYLAAAVSKTASRASTFSEISQRLNKGEIAIVYADSFYDRNSRIFVDGKLIADYIALVTERYPVHLRDKQDTLGERNVLSKCARAFGLRCLTEWQAFSKYYKITSKRGLAFRVLGIVMR